MHKGGRALSPVPFDGRRLGSDFQLLRPPRDEFMVLGGMMVGRDEIRHLIRPWRSLQSSSIASRILVRYLADRFRCPRGTRLLLGNALVGRLLFSYRQIGGALSMNTSLETLCIEHGRVTGAWVHSNGVRWRIHARRGVVLATGGPSSSSAWRSRLMPERDLPMSLAFEGNTGDGLDAALSIGGVLDQRHASPRSGRDLQFGKGDYALNRYNGDPDTAPNRCLSPIDSAPFFAVRVTPAPIGSSMGLRTDADARVLDQRLEPIAGLYACGNDMSSAMGGTYPGPGITLGPALVFGYRAARHAAGSMAEGVTQT